METRKHSDGRRTNARKERETSESVRNLRADNEKLRKTVAALRLEIETGEGVEVVLRRQLAQIENENRKFAGEYVDVEQHSSDLANLYVASYRLHATLDRNQVLAEIREIVINIIGSEEMAVFELDAARKELTASYTCGINDIEFRRWPLDKGLIGRVARTGEMYFAGKHSNRGALPAEANLTACVALKIDDETIGCLAVFRLVAQKSGLEKVDHEVFQLLGSHAAMALYCSGLHARLKANRGTPTVVR